MKPEIRKGDVTSIRAEYLDCCLSDYFQGSDTDEILAVPVWHGITYREAYEACKDEFHASSGYFDDVIGSSTLAEEALHALFSDLEDPENYVLPANGTNNTF